MEYKTKRNLKKLYKNSTDPQIKKDQKIATKRVEKFTNKRKEKKEYTTNVLKLRKALDEYEELMRDYYIGTKDFVYFTLLDFLSQEETIKAKKNKADIFSKDLLTKLSFFELDIGKIVPEQQKKFLAAKELNEYNHYLKRIFESAKYKLSEKEEEIINKLSKGGYENRTNMVSNFFANEEVSIKIDKKEEKKTFEELMTLSANSDKKIRDKAGKCIHEITEKHADVAEKELNSILEFRNTIDKFRGYKNPDTQRHIQDDVDTQVVDTLVHVVRKNYDISHRYYKIKTKLLGQDKMEYHERNVAPIQGDTSHFSFEQGIEILRSAFNNLDPYFTDILDNFLNKGLIDVFPKKGKSGGAFNRGLGKDIINIVLLNRTDKLNDVKTFAHEMGHAVHTHTIYQKQNALNADYGMFIAEVASTFMEDYVYQEILKQADPNLKTQIQLERINNYVSSVSRQIACYNIEKELHETRRKEGYLSKKTIGQIFTKHMQEYMGPYVNMSKGSENRRTYRSHIRYYFYVYSYAGGYLIAKALQKKVKQDPKFIKKYINIFLSAGTSEAPKETFQKMGIDITDTSFWESGIDEVRNMLTDIEKTLS